MANLTLIDWAKRVDPDGTTPIIANLLSQTNQILQDCVYVQGNLPTGHRVTIATGLPTIYYRALNQGIPTSKAVTAQVDEGCAIIEARSEVDLDLAMLNGSTAEFRLSEARLFIEGMNQAVATGLFYGNPSVDPKQFLGFAPRYSSLSAGNAQNIINGTGVSTANNTSIWLIGWGDQTVFCPFPKGSKAGLLQEDLGRQTSFDTGTTGQRLEVLAERFQWKTGLCVKDWRAAVRICNIDVTPVTGALLALTGNQAPTVFTNILHLMARAVARIPPNLAARLCFYMNRTVFSGLMRLALEKSNAALSVQAAVSQFGTPQAMMTFLNIPIRQVDAILNTEGQVT
jgi:hypothetical protein